MEEEKAMRRCFDLCGFIAALACAVTVACYTPRPATAAPAESAHGPEERDPSAQVLTGVTALAAGSDHSLALRPDGTVWSWGWNSTGQLGDGTTVDRSVPMRVRDLTGVTAIAAGEARSVALKRDGTVWGWGCGAYGQLGEEGEKASGNCLLPIQVRGLSEITGIAGGFWHSLALRRDGTVWGWGWNPYGQLGSGTGDRGRPKPVQVVGLKGVISIAAGWSHSIALRCDGTVWAWGDNGSGELGDGTTEDSLTPVQVQGLTEVVAIAAGGDHSLAVKRDGTVWSWGWNNVGQLGDGTTENRTIPVQVQGLTRIKAVAAGNAMGDIEGEPLGSYSLALRDDGTVWVWGSNDCRLLGDRTTKYRGTSAPVSGLARVTAVAAGYGHSLALKEDGTVWAWGDNSSGQLGDGTTAARIGPVPVRAPAQAPEIRAK
jgi:alpha-tubulin suppressor-like RCC1 family protein